MDSRSLDSSVRSPMKGTDGMSMDQRDYITTEQLSWTPSKDGDRRAEMSPDLSVSARSGDLRSFECEIVKKSII